MIVLLDGYRSLNYADPRRIEGLIQQGRLGKRLREDWWEIRKILNKLAALPSNLRYLTTLAKIQNYLRAVSQLISAAVLLIVAAFFFFYWGRNPEAAKQITDILTYIAPPLIAMLAVAKIAPFIISSKISKALENYRRENLERFVELENRIKVIVQQLIDSLSYETMKRKRAAEKRRNPQQEEEGGISEERRWLELKFDLMNIDYRGIKVVKWPGKIKKYYTVMIDVGD